MKAHSLKLAPIAYAAAFALCAVIVFLVVPPDLHAHVGMSMIAAKFVAPMIALTALRKQHADLVKRAEAKIGELVDGLAPEKIKAIEDEHAELERQAGELQTTIAEAEAEEAAARTATPPANPAEAVAAERTRSATIRDIGTRAGLPAAEIQTAIDTGVQPDAFRVTAFNALALRAQPIASVTPGNLDERETLRRGMADALVFRMSQRAADRVARLEAPSEIGRRFVNMGIVEMAAEAIGHRGHLRTAAQVDEVMRRAFLSTSDYPGIFGNAINARLLARYQASQPAYRRFAAQYNAVDFRAMNIIRAGDFPTLSAVPQTGVIPAGSFSESKETMTVAPYGVTFNLSRAMFINDNLGAIEQILGSAGARVTDWENAQVFTSLTSSSNLGPALATDTYHVFDSSHHANYTSSGTDISVTSIGVGRADMMAQTSLDGIKLNLMPTTLLCGPAKATVAEQIITQITPAQTSNAVPDWMKRLQVVADANISGNGWYLFADPMMAPCWVYGMLEGSQGPRLTTDDPFTIQGLSVKLEHDFGVAAIDYRGAYFNAGA